VRVLTVVHQPNAGPGVFAEEAAARGVELLEWRPPEGGAPPAGWDAALVLGGAMDADQEGSLAWLGPEKRAFSEWLDARLPVLGVCLGAQLVCEAAGGGVGRLSEPEIGWHEVAVTEAGRDDPVTAPLSERFTAFQWHSYAFEPPEGATVLATSAAGVQAVRLDDADYAIQFHAEVSSADALDWIADYESDPDAVRVGVDPERLAAETRARIAAWNSTGRALFGRWLDATRA
jgi:GMP synthase (glutamine-hydrolysing)